MAMKHKITINVSDPNGKKANVLRAADMRLPSRIARFLFDDFYTGVSACSRTDSGVRGCKRNQGRRQA